MSAAAETPRGRPQLLDAERVVNAALELLDTEGLTAVTFRRVSSELGVSHMTLYGYFPSKHELLEALVARTLAESQSSGGVASSWHEALLHRMRDIHAALLKRPGIAELLVTREFAGPSLVQVREQLLDILRSTGCAEAEAIDGISVVFNYLLGDAMVETRRGRGGSAASFERGMRYLITGLRHDLSLDPGAAS
ncbi:TetR/AcrR family transcriptional regulator [Pseudonocardia spinosispora]|uniref:TetR/AcrR family transcriptional regulator n=1 Tax=Pseudonocardia spinosispora TaxID=103441 RepID=UPI0004294078|nr:TetR family transcriptional regulator [Pseudonocardia spinosispora]